MSPSASPSGATDGPAGDPFSTVPALDERIPRNASVLSERLAAELPALDVAIEAWRRDGDLGVWPPPSEVELRTLFVQRAIRTLGQLLPR